MIQLLRNTFKTIVYSNVFVAIAAGFAVLSGSILMGISPLNVLEPAIIIFLSTFMVYNLQRLWRIERETDVGSELANERIEWIYAHRKHLILLMICTAIAILYILFQLRGILLYFIILSGAFAIFYVLPVYYSQRKWRMIREIPFIKIFLVGIVWVLATIIWPYLYVHGANDIFDLKFQLVAIERFMFIFAITLPFDVRDMAYDSRDKLKTFVLRFGIRKTIRVSTIILLSLSFFNIILMLASSDFENMYLMNAIHYIFTAWLVSLTNKNKGELFYSGLLESTIIVQFVLLWVSMG